ncbi:salt tolerance down-regulator-domain-containing protein [Chiua virens]|nr:salt tolerance down-regulator-domain-containing protein [Chiua virens]
MAAGKSQKDKQSSAVPSLAPTSRTPVPAASMQPTLSAVNGKKAKKKKGKGKETQSATLQDGELYDDVSNLGDPDMHLPPISGLSPQLESLHITTTGYTTLSQTSAGVTTQVHGEILATPGDIHWRNIEVQANGRTGARTAPLNSHPPLPKTNGANGPVLADDEYWSSFPPHIKNFAQTMYNIAQQMVQSDTYLKNGTATATATMATKGVPGYPPGAYPSLPFDPSIFSDPAFTLSVEQAAAAALGAVSPSPGQPPRGPLPQTNVVLLNEFEGGEHEFAEEDYYSEDEVDGNIEDEDLEDEFDLEPHPARPRTGPTATNPDAVAHVVLSYGETAGGRPARKTGVSTKTSITTKQNKQTKTAKSPAEAPVARSVPNTATAGEFRPASSAPETGPEKGGIRPTGAVDLTKRPPLTAANAMPPTRKENLTSNPPPSSRAQGKQPMAYPPTAATATTTTTTNSATTALPANAQQPARTARAQSKAPISTNPYSHNHTHHHPSPPSSNASTPHKPRPPAATPSTKPPQNNNKIWSTSTTEERERIKEFWLGLGEDERHNLVKIEKDTVLKKMKEQQKHSCSCAVCGRKRHAIEEELEVLYDAYYEELEQYANYQQRYVNSGGTIPPPPGPGPFPGSVELDKNGAVIGHPHTKPTHHPPRSNRTPALTNGRKPPKHESEFDDDEGDDDDYEEEDEYDDDDEEEEEEEEEEGAEEEDDDVKPRDRRNTGSRGRRPVNGNKANGRDGLFNLGSSLTVTGPNNILTVADDLLKNDGQKFLEMMEQLAERRMQREEEAAADVEDDSDIDDDDEGDDEDEEEDDEDDEDDDEEVMTEEQKMEEGKRMFSIFAARMFEQRVLQAYREKVAQERQQQLLRELEDEDKLTKEREAKKQTQNQKKKDKKRLQKQAKDEERAAKAVEKAVEEAALKAKQQAHEEELRKKKEEDKAKREAARKAAEEEKQRKDEERRKRLTEEREREAERERRRKEKEEKLRQERREREEKERKAREEREDKAAAEKAARETAKKEQQEKEEREKKLTKEREEKAEKERVAQQQRATAKSARQPTSPRASGSAQRSQSTNGSTKKILNKPVATSAASSTPSRATPQRPSVSTSQSATPVVPSTPSAFSLPVAPLYPPAPGMVPPSTTLPPFAPPPPFGVFGPGPSMSQGPPPSLAPSALPRGFGSPSPFDPPFSRGLPQPAPIGPPSKAVPNPLASPTLIPAGPSRKASLPEPGPVARPVSIAPIAPPAPIAPIARPTTGEASGSGSGSPVRRSPSPKGVLGSSALAADDDEVVPPPGRRGTVPGVVGQSWATTTNSRSGAESRPPWGPPAPLPAFGSPRPPPMGGSLWGNMGPDPSWQSPAGFFPNTFVNPINPSSPPHAGN